MLLTTLIASAAVGVPTIEKARVVDAALFKNGYSVVSLEATIPASGELAIEAPRGAVLGTFWLRADSGKLLEAVAATEDQASERDPREVDEYLEHAVGAHVILGYYASSQQTVEGTLLAVSKNFPGSSGSIVVQPDRSPNALVLQRQAVQTIQVSGDKVKFKITEKTPVPVIRLRGLRGTHVIIDMIKSGLWWSPAYSIDISKKDSLTLTSRAVIANDMYDLKGMNVRLITGFPNLPFLNQSDPMQTQVTLAAVLSGSGGGFGGGGFGGQNGQAMQFASNRAASPAPERDATFDGITMDAVKGFASEDLFMYPQQDITLKVGERMYRQLFQTNSKFEHVYTLAVPAEVDAAGNRTGGSPSDTLDVWHEIKFKNSAGMPLTTGPAMIVKDGNVVGQDSLNYTSINQEAHIKITKAIDIGARQIEEEKGRERGFIKDRFNNPRHDRITVAGSIEIFNRKDTPVDLEVSKVLFGEVTESSDAGTAAKSPGSMWEVNPESTIKWHLKLAPNQLTKVTYSYTALRNPT